MNHQGDDPTADQKNEQENRGKKSRLMQQNKGAVSSRWSQLLFLHHPLTLPSPLPAPNFHHFVFLRRKLLHTDMNKTWAQWHALVTGLTLDILDLLSNVFVLGWQDLVASVSVLCASSVSCHLAYCGQLPAGLQTDHLFSLSSPETFMKSLQIPAMNVPTACSSIFCIPDSARTILMKWSLNLDCRIPV